MLRRLLLLVMAIWVARLARTFRPGAGRRMSGFPPADGGPHPAKGPSAPRRDGFSPEDVVDGEYEDVPARPRS